MPTIGNVNRGTNLTHHFFQSKVGVGRWFQYGGRRRSQNPRARADERLTGGWFWHLLNMSFTQKRPEIIGNTCTRIVKLDCSILFVGFFFFFFFYICAVSCQIAGWLMNCPWLFIWVLKFLLSCQDCPRDRSSCVFNMMRIQFHYIISSNC